MQVGELVGRGRTSDVYEYGPGSVIKLPHDDVPHEWAEFEAAVTDAVVSMGVPAPQVRDVVTVQGRRAVVFERIDGESMWQQMVADPSTTAGLARELAAIQRALLSTGIPAGVPELVDRMARKIRLAPALTTAEQDEAISRTEQLPRGAALLHGDLHPGNVLMGANGPVVIDWFDATIGHPVADVVRSSILMQPGAASEPRHLPGASRELLSQLHASYLAEFHAELLMSADDLASWQAVVAAARMSEGAEVNEEVLSSLWADRNDVGGARRDLLQPAAG
jgi:aminoglycoside phosphotransferase (APT) family kinase protein